MANYLLVFHGGAMPDNPDETAKVMTPDGGLRTGDLIISLDGQPIRSCVTPVSAAKRRAASSMRTIRPSASTTTSRAPISAAVTSMTS